MKLCRELRDHRGGGALATLALRRACCCALGHRRQARARVPVQVHLQKTLGTLTTARLTSRELPQGPSTPGLLDFRALCCLKVHFAACVEKKKKKKQQPFCHVSANVTMFSAPSTLD